MVSFGQDHRHSWVLCPICGYGMDASTFVQTSLVEDGPAPADGDISICLACGAVNVFAFVGATRTLRPPTPEERAKFARNPAIQITVQTIIDVRLTRLMWPKGDSR